MGRWAYVVVLAGIILGGCSDSQAPSERSNTPQYLVTLPVLHTIVQPLTDGRATSRAILQPGDSPHTFDPRPSTVRAAGQSHALIYGADELDAWAAQLDAPQHISLMDVLPASYHRTFPQDSIRGGALGNDENRDADHDHRPGDPDPHFWLDPLAVKALLSPLADTLCASDAEGCETYRANARIFADSLQALHTEIDDLLSPVRDRPFMTSQPFLHYFAARYDLRLEGVVERSPAHEPSARRIHALIRHAEDADVGPMIYQAQLPATSARAVAEGAGLPMVVLDPLGGVPNRDTYTALLRHNAYAVHAALTQPEEGSPRDR